jgi:hypothetical protein
MHGKWDGGMKLYILDYKTFSLQVAYLISTFFYEYLVAISQYVQNMHTILTVNTQSIPSYTVPKDKIFNEM